jgi:hypothetical protein
MARASRKKKTAEETCYMCERPSVSKEHVPPECLFPAPKEVGGKDLKKELIKVPSCDEHNLKKSKDDEYLWYVLSMCEHANDAGQEQASTKLFRAIQRRPTLLNRIMKDSQSAAIVDSDGVHHTKELFAESDRLNAVMEQIGRGLYYHHFKKKWKQEILLDCEFLRLVGDKSASVMNARMKKVRQAAKEVFSRSEVYGKNPEIFNYRVHSENGKDMMQLCFYGNARATMCFVPIEYKPSILAAGEGEVGWADVEGECVFAEKMVMLAFPSATPGTVVPCVQKGCVFLFSAPERLKAWIVAKGSKVPSNLVGFFLNRYEESRKVLETLQRKGCTLVCVDADGELTYPMKIENAVKALDSLIRMGFKDPSA